MNSGRASRGLGFYQPGLPLNRWSPFAAGQIPDEHFAIGAAGSQEEMIGRQGEGSHRIVMAVKRKEAAPIAELMDRDHGRTAGGDEPALPEEQLTRFAFEVLEIVGRSGFLVRMEIPRLHLSAAFEREDPRTIFIEERREERRFVIGVAGFEIAGRRR